MVQISQLTDITIRNLKHGEYWDQKLPSFGVRVGKRFTTFLLKKENRRVKLGHYPSLSLADARRRVFSLKADPETIAVHITLREARTLFFDTHCNHYRPKVLKETKRYLAKYDTYQENRLSKLTTHSVLKIIDVQTRAEANKLFTVSRTFFRFLTKRRLLQRSPLEGLPIPNKQNKRTRVLTDHELKLIWRACESVRVQTPNPTPRSAQENFGVPRNFATIVKLLILTGMRRTECASIQTSWIKADLLTLPSEICKNGREFTLPLGALAVGILTDHTSKMNANSSLLFPARGTTNRSFNGWSKSKKLLDKASGVTGYTLHDIRRTFRTNLGRLGVAPHIAERTVNHVSAQTDMEITYNRWTYLPELRDAAERHEAHLRKILEIK